MKAREPSTSGWVPTSAGSPTCRSQICCASHFSTATNRPPRSNKADPRSDRDEEDTPRGIALGTRNEGSHSSVTASPALSATKVRRSVMPGSSSSRRGGSVVAVVVEPSSSRLVPEYEATSAGSGSSKRSAPKTLTDPITMTTAPMAISSGNQGREVGRCSGSVGSGSTGMVSSSLIGTGRTRSFSSHASMSRG